MERKGGKKTRRGRKEEEGKEDFDRETKQNKALD